MSDVQIELPSERERELLQLLSLGLSNREIALKMHISPNTVKVHLRNIFAKLNVYSRTEAVMVAIKNGWVVVEGAAVPTMTEMLVPPQAVAPSPEQPPEQPPEPSPQPSPPRVVFEFLSAPPLQVTRWQRVYLISSFIVILLVFSFVRLGRPTLPVIEKPPVTPTVEGVAGRDVTWEHILPLANARSRMAAVFYNNHLYVIGGETWRQDEAVVSNLVQVYDVRTQTWVNGPTLPVAVADVGGVALRGRLFVPGGRLADGTIGNQLQVFDPAEGRWYTGRPLPKPLSACAVVAYAGDLYLFGGWDGQGVVDSAYLYDPQREVWTALAPMPTPRAFLAAGTIGEHIYVVGGHDGQNDLPTCEVYAPNEDRWALCPPMNRPRSGIGAAVIGTKLFVIGGGQEGTTPLLDSEIWTPDLADPTKGSWQSMSSPVIGRWQYLGVTVNAQEMLYAVGGWSNRPLDTVWIFRPLYRIYLPMSSGG